MAKYFCYGKIMDELYPLVNARYDEKIFTWNFPVISSFKNIFNGLLDKIFVIDEYMMRKITRKS